MKDPWLADDVICLFRHLFARQNDITWVKSIAVKGETSGQFRPINSDRLLNRTNEQVYHLSKTGRVPIDRLAIGVPYQDKSNLGRWNHATEDRRCGGNSWFMPYEPASNAAGKYGHPAIFPLELPRRCLKLHGRRGLVLDPFAGTGTTLVAAKQLGWRSIGIEIDETYVETARRRINVDLPGFCGERLAYFPGLSLECEGAL
ncbi:site-specific DNA-methyltransferase, partial [uncultured Paracoccus sp.]|uniref:DNA-methyltransferase n=1 Tax=uncultured Paracoccus sp. TaxID=189685 RepID=UPI0026163670